MNRPSRLRPGDRVAVVSPASPVVSERLDAGIEVLRSWGLEVEVGAHAYDSHPTFDYLAGLDADRAADLTRAWADPGIAAVFCARGGYGCQRTLQHVDFDALPSTEKIFAGSSDVTALHAMLAPRLVTLFSPMVATDAFLDSPENREHLRRTLFAPETTTVLRGVDACTLAGGAAEGVTAGGNLSLLVSSLGVPGVSLPPDGAIALIEDFDEQWYRVDQFLTQLLRAGWFDRVAGIAFGSWQSCGELDAVREVVADRLAPLGVPMVWELGFGHGPLQLTIPLGAHAKLDADAATLTLTEPALA